MSDVIDITGIGKPELLAALYNNSKPIGLGFLQATPESMTYREAEIIIEQQGKRFDYLKGRPLKCDLSGDTFDPWGYDRDNGGPGSALRVVQAVRDGVTLLPKSASEMSKGLDDFIKAAEPTTVRERGGITVFNLGVDDELKEALEKARAKFSSNDNGDKRPKSGEGGPS